LALLGAIIDGGGDFAESERLLRRAIAVDSKHFNAHHDLGRLLVRAHHYGDALPILQGTATLNSKDPTRITNSSSAF